MVEDLAALEALVEALGSADVIGVDTEADSFHHYQEKVCLIQISDKQHDWIVDPLCFGPGELEPLGGPLADPKIVKVLHGADYDIVSLKRDFGFQTVNIFDTMMAAQFLALPRIGLADLIERYFGQHIDKKYQRHDWFERPLLPEHLQYARGDTHWLLAIREMLLHKLDAIGLAYALAEECAIIEQREWSGRDADDSVFLRTKGASALGADGRRVLRALWEYRDEQARQMDRPAFKVMPGDALISVAKAKPKTREELDKVLRAGSSLVRRHGDQMVAAVVAGLADERPLPERTASKTPRRRAASGPGLELLLGPLKDWRNRVVETRGLNPVVVANNQLLKEIARTAPEDVEALAEVPGIRRWQVHEYGEEILEIVRGATRPRPAKKRRRRRKLRSEAASE